jgi:hypothetical protein
VRSVLKQPQNQNRSMFTFKNSQLIALAAKGKEDFIMKMMELLRSDFDEIKTMDDSALHQEIDLQISKANRYGFTLNSTIASYIVSAFVMGENFDTDFKVASKILNSNMDEQEKCNKTEEWVTEIFSALENN